MTNGSSSAARLGLLPFACSSSMSLLTHTLYGAYYPTCGQAAAAAAAAADHNTRRHRQALKDNAHSLSLS